MIVKELVLLILISIYRCGHNVYVYYLKHKAIQTNDTLASCL